MSRIRPLLEGRATPGSGAGATHRSGGWPITGPGAGRPVWLILSVALAAGFVAAPCDGQEQPAVPAPPLFAEAWVGGPLDSIYNAEYARLSEACGPDALCFRERLDTTAVRLAPVWSGPTDRQARGWLMARLRTEGRWPRAVLLFGGNGAEVTLRRDLGDWGYGVTLPLADTTADRVRPIFPELDGPIWLARSGGPGFGVLDVFGLEGRLWRLAPVRGHRRGGEDEVELPAGVYKVLEVPDGRVVLRPAVPSDMPCGEVDEPDPGAPPVYEVALDRLVGPDGVPRVEVAYPKGC